MSVFRDSCLPNYVSHGKLCPCHPAESAIAVAVLEKVVQDLIVKSIKELARSFIDDELVLSEEVIV